MMMGFITSSCVSTYDFSKKLTSYFPCCNVIVTFLKIIIFFLSTFLFSDRIEGIFVERILFISIGVIEDSFYLFFYFFEKLALFEK